MRGSQGCVCRVQASLGSPGSSLEMDEVAPQSQLVCAQRADGETDEKAVRPEELLLQYNRTLFSEGGGRVNCYFRGPPGPRQPGRPARVRPQHGQLGQARGGQGRDLPRESLSE